MTQYFKNLDKGYRNKLLSTLPESNLTQTREIMKEAAQGAIRASHSGGKVIAPRDPGAIASADDVKNSKPVLPQIDYSRLTATQFQSFSQTGKQILATEKIAYVLYNSEWFKRGRHIFQKGTSPWLYSDLAKEQRAEVKQKMSKVMHDHLSELGGVLENGLHDVFVFATALQRLTFEQRIFPGITLLPVESLITLDENFDVRLATEDRFWTVKSGVGGVMSQLLNFKELFKDYRYIRVIDANVRADYEEELCLTLGVMELQGIECLLKVAKRKFEGDSDMILFSKNGRVRVSDVGCRWNYR